MFNDGLELFIEDRVTCFYKGRETVGYSERIAYVQEILVQMQCPNPLLTVRALDDRFNYLLEGQRASKASTRPSSKCNFIEGESCSYIEHSGPNLVPPAKETSPGKKFIFI